MRIVSWEHQVAFLVVVSNGTHPPCRLCTTESSSTPASRCRSTSECWTRNPHSKTWSRSTLSSLTPSCGSSEYRSTGGAVHLGFSRPHFWFRSWICFFLFVRKTWTSLQVIKKSAVYTCYLNRQRYRKTSWKHLKKSLETCLLAAPE